MRPDELHSQTCRVVTRGRTSGAKHVVTVWFVIIDGRFYAASRHGLQSDWLQNALHAGSLEVRSGKGAWQGAASLAAPEELATVLNAFTEKYAKYASSIEEWRADAPVFARADLA